MLIFTCIAKGADCFLNHVPENSDIETAVNGFLGEKLYTTKSEERCSMILIHFKDNRKEEITDFVKTRQNIIGDCSSVFLGKNYVAFAVYINYNREKYVYCYRCTIMFLFDEKDRLKKVGWSGGGDPIRTLPAGR